MLTNVLYYRMGLRVGYASKREPYLCVFAPAATHMTKFATPAAPVLLVVL